jgi:uncharacterized Tic20 family protein
VVWPFLIAPWIGELVIGVVAGLKAYDGARFRYPLTLRMILDSVSLSARATSP